MYTVEYKILEPVTQKMRDHITELLTRNHIGCSWNNIEEERDFSKITITIERSEPELWIAIGNVIGSCIKSYQLAAVLSEYNDKIISLQNYIELHTPKT